MKIAEQIETDGQTIQIKQTHDVQAVLDRAKRLRDAGTQRGENRLVGSIPMELAQAWLDEAGVRWDDVEARQSIFERKLMDGEFSKLRVWDGRF